MQQELERAEQHLAVVQNYVDELRKLTGKSGSSTRQSTSMSQTNDSTLPEPDDYQSVRQLTLCLYRLNNGEWVSSLKDVPRSFQEIVPEPIMAIWPLREGWQEFRVRMYLERGWAWTECIPTEPDTDMHVSKSTEPRLYHNLCLYFKLNSDQSTKKQVNCRFKRCAGVCCK